MRRRHGHPAWDGIARELCEAAARDDWSEDVGRAIMARRETAQLDLDLMRAENDGMVLR